LRADCRTGPNFLLTRLLQDPSFIVESGGPGNPHGVRPLARSLAGMKQGRIPLTLMAKPQTRPPGRPHCRLSKDAPRSPPTAILFRTSSADFAKGALLHRKHPPRDPAPWLPSEPSTTRPGAITNAADLALQGRSYWGSSGCMPKSMPFFRPSALAVNPHLA